MRRQYGIERNLDQIIRTTAKLHTRMMVQVLIEILIELHELRSLHYVLAIFSMISVCQSVIDREKIEEEKSIHIGSKPP